MIVIACVDDRMGMLFNRRRQSQDAALRQRLLERAAGRPIWMSEYSARQFADCPATTSGSATAVPTGPGRGEAVVCGGRAGSSSGPGARRNWCSTAGTGAIPGT